MFCFFKGTKRVMNDDENYTTYKKQRIAKPIQDPSTSSSVIQQGKNRTDSLKIRPITSGAKLSNKTESTNKDIKKDDRLSVNSKPKPFVQNNENGKGQKVSKEGSSPTVASTSDIPEHIM